MAQVALAWVLSKPVVSAPIVGATKPHHLSDAVAALDLRLSDEEIAALEAPYRPGQRLVVSPGRGQVVDPPAGSRGPASARTGLRARTRARRATARRGAPGDQPGRPSRYGPDPFRGGKRGGGSGDDEGGRAGPNDLDPVEAEPHVLRRRPDRVSRPS
ncbi:aldo/keto reductase [Asanoa siamensis]|uniref:aldo/keto reductase n=1 Tax=Asanoa siamensis TaxID=926357 RepID=UPI001EF24D59|nr:aldo/keto reductase [Asanoa siamensis]